MDQQVFTDVLRYGTRISHTEEGWISPLLDAVIGVDFQVAKWKPSPDVASIWEIVAHAIPYTESRASDLDGGDNPNEEDWPVISDTSSEAWNALQERVKAAVDRLQRAVESADAETLGSPRPGKEAARAERLMDIIVHDSYHAGQIIKLQQIHASVRELSRTGA